MIGLIASKQVVILFQITFGVLAWFAGVRGETQAGRIDSRGGFDIRFKHIHVDLAAVSHAIQPFRMDGSDTRNLRAYEAL